MPIPAFTIDGVLPPFVGPTGPGGARQDMTPYLTTAQEVVTTFGSSERRRNILLGWLNFRSHLRAAGVVRGFQWLDGSFVEDKEPKDIDVMTFFYRPLALQDLAQRPAWLRAYGHLLNRVVVKVMFDVDSMVLDLNGSPEALVDSTRYYGSLFSHQRGTDIWKGMLAVRLEDQADDQAALAAIGPPSVISAPGVGP